MKVIHTSGKRKRAIARATLKKGNGKITINKVLLENYTPKLAKLKLEEPLLLAEGVANDVDIRINVRGGGKMSQAEASRLVIAKALVEWTKSKSLEERFLNYDRHLLVADVRRKEPYKPGISKARKKRQKSYR